MTTLCLLILICVVVVVVVVQESMGYKTGQGLGRSGDGITAPISQSSQLGRRGFGYAAGGLERENVKWEEEEVTTTPTNDIIIM